MAIMQRSNNSGILSLLLGGLIPDDGNIADFGSNQKDSLGRETPFLSNDEQIDAELLGMPAPIEGKNGIIPGPFDFDGYIPDNATTSIDLTSSNACTDPKLNSMGSVSGTTDPAFFLVITDVLIELDTFSADAETLLFDAARRMYVKYTPGEGRTLPAPKVLRAGNFTRTFTSAVAAADTNTTTSVKALSRERPAFHLPTPWIVDLQTDSLSLEFSAATNLAANVPLVIRFYGFAIPKGNRTLRNWVNPCVSPKQAFYARHRDEIDRNMGIEIGRSVIRSISGAALKRATRMLKGE